MKKWYIVKSNWEKTLNNLTALGLKEYYGLGGNLWPECSLYNEIEKAREYIELDSGEFFYVVTDVFIAMKYCKELEALEEGVILLELKEGVDTYCDGYDFGSPDGGYSVIESEIITKLDTVYAKRFLNDYGLFYNLESLEAFLNTLDRNYVEDMYSYQPVSIKNITHMINNEYI
ncbi:hypothetical protein Z042_04885 [Chania multitudinisentens RB-25]|uniref:Uncharacterized protein n=1 Tax=Chania multitudinisentens RB-25 TaxID=1441930 RepID=W0LK02_9GAMM|nr:hypothetical protein [Chania multitudinisentens]AHG22662.1 hypothetical protein Z042_04885 [Chania multitudinisentens RB-25]